MSQLTLFNCKVPFSKQPKAKAVNQVSSSAATAVTMSGTEVLASHLRGEVGSHVQVSDNNIVDFMSKTPDECINCNSMFFTASRTPLHCCTPDFISTSEEECQESIIAEFSSGNEVAANNRHHSHSDSMQVSTISTDLSATSVLTRSSSTEEGFCPPLPLVSTTTDAVTSRYQANNGPRDIAQTPALPPAQPINIRFPYTKFGNTTKCFNPGSTRPEPVFVSKGFQSWKYAIGKTGALFRHANCHSHTQAQIPWGQYKVNSKQGTTISGRMNSNRPVTISNNWYYIKTIAEVLLLCGRQELGLRGHREGSESVNPGNFLEILHLVAQHDPLVKCRIDNGPRNSTYTSPDIQNDMLGVMAGLIQEQICNEVRKAGVYSILTDETKDCSKAEQLAVVLKYVDVHTATQHERF